MIEFVVTILTQVETNDGTNVCISCMTTKSQLSYALLGEVCKKYIISVLCRGFEPSSKKVIVDCRRHLPLDQTSELPPGVSVSIYVE